MLEKEKQKFSEQRESGKGDLETSLGKYLLILYHTEEEPHCLKIQNSIIVIICHHSGVPQFHDTYHDNFVQN